MATHVEIGKAGEKLAEVYLIDKEFTILYRNWRCSYEEIDLVATKNGMLHFIEVKYRSTNRYGHPEEAVTKPKIKKLLKAIEQFLYRHPQYNDFRLDILSITEKGEQGPEYFFIEDVTL